MPSVAVVKELINAGLSGEALVAALERIETAERSGSPADKMSADDRRRERDRVRKSAERLRKSADNPRTDADIVSMDSPRKSTEIHGQSADSASRAVLDINNNNNLTKLTKVYINKTNTPLTPQSTDNPRTNEDLFETKFWNAYPRKAGKGHARRAWKPAILKTSPWTIIAAAERFAALCVGKDENYIPHASTWLTGERWQDADLQPGHVATDGIDPKRAAALARLEQHTAKAMA